jgi:hypothetical protein
MAEAVRPKVRGTCPKRRSKRVYAIYEDIVIDDDWIAKAMANLASHGLTFEEWRGMTFEDWPTEP